MALAVLLVAVSLLGLTGVGLAQPEQQEPPLSFAPASFPQGVASSTATDCLWVGENYGEPNAQGRGAVAGSEHLSSLREAHLRQLAADTGLRFMRLQDSADLAPALTDASLARPVTARFDLRGWLAGIALALLAARHLRLPLHGRAVAARRAGA